MDIKLLLEGVINQINEEEPKPKKVKVCLDKESQDKKKLKICVEENIVKPKVEGKKRGRPSKPKVEVEEKPKGKRGRPKKEKVEEKIEPKKRGRPSKPKVESEEKTEPKQRGRPAKVKPIMSSPVDLTELSKTIKKEADVKAIADLASIVEKAKKIKPKNKKVSFVPKPKKAKSIKAIKIIKDTPKGSIVVTPNEPLKIEPVKVEPVKVEPKVDIFKPKTDRYADKSPFEREAFLYDLSVRQLKDRLIGINSTKQLKAQINKMKDKKEIILAVLEKEQTKYGIITPVITNALNQDPYRSLKVNEAFKRYMKDIEVKPEPVKEDKPEVKPVVVKPEVKPEVKPVDAQQQTGTKLSRNVKNAIKIIKKAGLKVSSADGAEL